MTQENRLNAL